MSSAGKNRKNDRNGYRDRDMVWQKPGKGQKRRVFHDAHERQENRKLLRSYINDDNDSDPRH